MLISVPLGSPRHSTGPSHQSTLGSHPRVGGAPGAAPARGTGATSPLPFLAVAMSGAPGKKVGRLCLGSSRKERREHLPAGMRKEEGAALHGLGCPAAACVLGSTARAGPRRMAAYGLRLCVWLCAPAPVPSKPPEMFPEAPLLWSESWWPAQWATSLGSELTPQLCPPDNGRLSAQDGHEGLCHGLVT